MTKEMFFLFLTRCHSLSFIPKVFFKIITKIENYDNITNIMRFTKILKSQSKNCSIQQSYCKKSVLSRFDLVI